jgi:hypothetical protein
LSNHQRETNISCKTSKALCVIVSIVCIVFVTGIVTTTVQALSIVDSISSDGRDTTIPGSVYFLYEDPDFGYSVEYPDESELTQSDNGVSFYIPSIGAILGISVFDAEDMTLPQFTTERLNHAENQVGLTIESVVDDILAGQDARMATFYGYTDEGTPMSGVFKFTMSNGVGYQLMLASHPSNVNDFIPIAQHMLDSFQISSGPSQDRTAPDDGTEFEDPTGGIGT